ncbi:MAG: protease HtpX [Holophagales bacterium]|jgi:heat shock protein HtpX|nr:protease HtpX [Holophagales bacterium]
MKIAKRVFLFVAVNVLVVATISIVLSVLGVRPYLTARGLNLPALAVFCLVWGFGGAFISLALSRVMAKWGMGVKLVDPNTPDVGAQELVSTVHRLAQAAGLRTMPQVGVYDSDEVNAFATGPTKNRSLVAVSTGLLRRLRRDEVEGVLGHEIAHVANGDMVTMTLVQGVVNAFTMFLARVLAFFVAQLFRRDEEDGGISHVVYFVATLVFDIAFSILGSVVVAWFSRLREFRADAGGAGLAGRDRMVAALEALQRTYGVVDPGDRQAAVQTLKISGHPTGLMRFFSTHPPLEVRIARLKALA